MNDIQMQYDKLQAKIAMAQGDDCDKYDYLIAVGCGSIAGLIDIFLVGSPADSKLLSWTDSQVDNAVMKFAKLNGWKPKKGNENKVNSAIGYLETRFKVNYDQRHSGDVNNLFKMSTKNHHIKSLAHSPDVVGLFFSIINQFTSTSTFVSNGRLITIDTETQELNGHDFISKLFCGTANWFGHIMSDIAGSSGAKTRGSGVVIPFFELFQFCDFGKFKTYQFDKNGDYILNRNQEPKYYINNLSTIATKAFEEGYDARFGLTMAIPVVLSDLLIKFCWSIKQFFYHKKTLVESIPTNKHKDLRVMLIIGNATLCLMDGADSLLKSKGDAVSFLVRLNYVAWMKLCVRVIKEIMIIYDFTYEDLKIQFEYLNYQLDLYIKDLKQIDYQKYEYMMNDLYDINRSFARLDLISASDEMTSYIKKNRIDTTFTDMDSYMSAMTDLNNKVKF